MRFLTVELEKVNLVRGDRRVLRNITWRVRPGERWALLGDNGAGKTQLLKLLAGDVWPSPASRRLYRLGDVAQTEPLGIKEYIAYIGAERQDKYARYDWNFRVEELVGTGLFATDIVLHEPDAAQRRRVRAALRSLGLERLAGRRMLTLSYGEQRLALIARALAARPRLLLLDEVFNGLDQSRRAALMSYLERSRRARMPWVLSLHREEDLPAAATHVLVLENGRVRSRGKRASRPIVEFFRRAQRAAKRPADGSRRAASRRAFAVSLPLRRSGPGAPRITVSNADVYVEHRLVIRNLDWQIREGEHWAVLGGNGSGKSTLLKLLHGELWPALGGVIERAGFPRATPLEEFRRTVGMLSAQLQSDHARDDLTVEEIVMSGRHASIGLNERPSAADRRAARRSLEASGLIDLRNRRPRELSYGQMRRVLIARATVNRPQLLLLDEPCTGLDAGTRAIVLARLEQLARQGVPVVMATHHGSDLIPSINRILRLRKGTASVETRAALAGAAPPGGNRAGSDRQPGLEDDHP